MKNNIFRGSSQRNVVVSLSSKAGHNKPPYTTIMRKLVKILHLHEHLGSPTYCLSCWYEPLSPAVMALVKLFCCSLTLSNKWQESLASSLFNSPEWWGQFSPLSQPCRVGQFTNAFSYLIGSFSCKFVIRTLPSSTISFCKTLDFIINFFIAWNHMQITIQVI